MNAVRYSWINVNPHLDLACFRGGYRTRKSLLSEFPSPCSLEGSSAAGGELAPHRALHQRAYTHNPTAWCTAAAPSPVRYALTFRLSHFCCCVRTDSLPFERDVRRSLRRTSTDAIQTAQMALVMAIDSIVGGELGARELTGISFRPGRRRLDEAAW